MRSKAGIVLMLLGAALLSGALLLFLFNQKQDDQAAEAAVQVLPQLVEQIQANNPETDETDLSMDLLIPEELLTEEDVAMEEMEVDGNGYIGYVTLPALDLELPVQGSWSYPKLRISPCRYTGTLRGGNLVIMAHNYWSHFGKLSQLQVGDNVYFTDITGRVTQFAVMAKDILEPTAVEEITRGDFDLTLFTCTYGGASRVTVFCDKVTE